MGTIIFLVIFALLGLFLILLATVNTIYCFFCEHEDWKLWEHYIKIEKEFVWDGEKGRFVIPNTGVRAYIWKNGLCSIHWKDDWEDDCLCTFDTYHSKKMAKLLGSKIK